MTLPRRISKINSLLKEVISDVIIKEVKHPNLAGKLLTITAVHITKDLRQARVFISVLGDDSDKAVVIDALTSAAGFIAVAASKKVSFRFFPDLVFKIDNDIEKHMHIDKILYDINAEREQREQQQNTNHGSDE